MNKENIEIEIPLSSLGLAGAYLGEQRIEQLEIENTRLREALGAWLRLMHDSQWENAWKLSQAALREQEVEE